MRVANEEDFVVGDLIMNPAHQGRCLRSLLLGRVEAEARRRGVAFVIGRIVAKDFAAFSGLRALYQKHRYDVQAVEAPPPKAGMHDVARIKKNVNDALGEDDVQGVYFTNFVTH